MKRLVQAVLLPIAICYCHAGAAYELGNWDVHGTLSQGWIHSTGNNIIADSKDGTFAFREFGLNTSTTLGEKVTVGGQLFGRKFGDVGDDKVYLDWLSLSYTFADELGLRVGKLKMPYGLYGETRDVDSLRTTILLPQGVYAESYRGSFNAMVGGAIFGNASFSRWGSIEYSLQVGQSDVDEDSGELSRLASYVELEVDGVEDGDAGALKLFWDTPAKGLRLGTTYLWSEFSVDGRAAALTGSNDVFQAEIKEQYFLVNSVEYTTDRVTLSAERLFSSINTDIRLKTTPGIPVTFDVRLSANAFTVQYRTTDRLTLALGYSSFSLKQKVLLGSLEFRAGGGGKDQQNSVFASLRYDVTPNLVAKVEQHVVRGEGGVFASENPDIIRDDWAMTLMKLSFVF